MRRPLPQWLGAQPFLGRPRRGTGAWDQLSGLQRALTKPDPCHIRFTTYGLARVEIELHKRAGKPLSKGKAIDSNGNPTADPDAELWWLQRICAVDHDRAYRKPSDRRFDQS